MIQIQSDETISKLREIQLLIELEKYSAAKSMSIMNFLLSFNSADFDRVYDQLITCNYSNCHRVIDEILYLSYIDKQSLEINDVDEDDEFSISSSYRHEGDFEKTSWDKETYCSACQQDPCMCSDPW